VTTTPVPTLPAFRSVSFRRSSVRLNQLSTASAATPRSSRFSRPSNAAPAETSSRVSISLPSRRPVLLSSGIPHRSLRSFRR
jgi:hypothetical protein